MSTAMLRPQEN